MRTRHGRTWCRPGLLSIALGVLLVACGTAGTPPPAPASGASRPDASGPTGAVRSMAALTGRSLANGTVPGTVSDLLYTRALAKEGVNPSGIDKQYMPFPDILASLGNGKMDGGTMTEPLVTQGVHQRIAEVL